MFQNPLTILIGIYILIGVLLIFTPSIRKTIPGFYSETIEEGSILATFLFGALVTIILILILGVFIGFYPILYPLRYKAYRKEGEFERKDKVIRNKFVGIEKPHSQKILVKVPPFEVTTNQILYIETSTNKLVSNLFTHKITEINSILNYKERYSKEDFKVIYLPEILSGWLEDSANFSSIVNYNLPYLSKFPNKRKTYDNERSSSTFLSNEILNILGYSGEKYNGFLRATNIDNGSFGDIEFSYFKFDPQSEEEFYKLLWYYSYHLGERPFGRYDQRAAYRIVEEDDPNVFADKLFAEEAHKIADDVKKKIELLAQKGFQQLILHALADVDPKYIAGIAIEKSLPNKLSHLHIDQENNIFLPDYDVEIHLTPIQKALYYLFIRHPEGILFSELPNYRDELLELYKNLMYFDDWERTVASVINLTDHQKNSINENCAKIKSAFLQHFDNSLAKYYYITGIRGMVKKILLDPKYIEIDNELILNKSTIPFTRLNN